MTSTDGVSPDRLHHVNIGAQKTLAQDALSNHTGNTKKNYLHCSNRSHKCSDNEKPRIDYRSPVILTVP